MQPLLGHLVARRPVLPDPGERRLAGRIGGWLWMSAGGSGVSLVLLQPDLVEHRSFTFFLGLFALTWAFLVLTVVPWERLGGWALVTTTWIGLLCTALQTYGLGGLESPLRLNVLLVIVYAAYFLPPRVAAGLVLASAGVLVTPVLYDPDGNAATVTQLLLDASQLVVLGGVMIGATTALRGWRAEAELLGRRQAALGGLARQVAEERPPAEVLEATAAHVGPLLGADAAIVLRADASGRATVVAVWSGPGRPAPAVGSEVPVPPGSHLDRVLAGTTPVRWLGEPEGLAALELDLGTIVAAPVVVPGGAFGVLLAGARLRSELPADAERHLAAFAEIASLSVAAAANRAELVVHATVDSLTGLTNRRAFRDRVRVELERARRAGGVVALAVVDVDEFKSVNDSEGHDAGDRVLRTVATALEAGGAREELAGRLGGDEFAVLLPGSTAAEARVVLERARLAIATAPAAGSAPVTISVGVADTSHAATEEHLLRRADEALFWSKARGRDQTSVYDPAVAPDADARLRAERRRRSQALIGLHALARVVDARDRTTRQHAARVAEWAVRLARGLQWAPERVARLEEAAILHDVGKIAIGDAGLLGPGPLVPAEDPDVRDHPALGARIVKGVLDAEQVSWVRGHHERPDGGGYPDGLAGAAIPDGAAVLGVANLMDVLVSGRAGAVPLTAAGAVARCALLAPGELDADVVGALLELDLGGSGPADRQSALAG